MRVAETQGNLLVSTGAFGQVMKRGWCPASALLHSYVCAALCCYLKNCDTCQSVSGGWEQWSCAKGHYAEGWDFGITDTLLVPIVTIRGHILLEPSFCSNPPHWRNENHQVEFVYDCLPVSQYPV